MNPGIVERTICTISPLSTTLHDWDRVTSAVEAAARQIGRSTAHCMVESHYLRITDIRLQGVGDVDSALISACHMALASVGMPSAQVHVERKTLLIRCNRATDLPRLGQAAGWPACVFYTTVWCTCTVLLLQTYELHGNIFVIIEALVAGGW